MIRASLAAAALAVVAAVPIPAAADALRMAVTTSFANSGLAEVLLPAIRADTGIVVELIVVGTGQALRLGEAGDVDAVLTHALPAEEAFVAAGHAPHRREIMTGDFIVLGPSADPAGVAVAADAAAAFAAIAAAEAPFVSRGDDSGTHQKELELWAAAKISPSGRWYRAVGAGMGAALNTAAATDAYILSDRATWLAFGNKAGLVLLLEGDPVLFTQYAFLPVSAAKGTHIRAETARQLEDWLTGPRAAALIDGFVVDGENVFVFNATPRG